MPDGAIAYTRDGAFQIDNQGQLVTSSGYALQPAIVIPADATSITVGRDGTVSITQAGAANTIEIGAIQLTTFINPAGLMAKGENLYVETTSSGNANNNAPGTNGAGTLAQGFVETSNVNVVEELVNMIQTQRAYEINSKSITTSDQMLQKLAQM
jgi:flagellar basal-body rod protein FlgG